MAVYSYHACSNCSTRSTTTCEDHGSCKYRAGGCQEDEGTFTKEFCAGKATQTACQQAPADKACKWTGAACIALTGTEKMVAFGCVVTPAPTLAPAAIKRVEITVYDGVTYSDIVTGAVVTLSDSDLVTELKQTVGLEPVFFDVSSLPGGNLALKIEKAGYVTENRGIDPRDCKTHSCQGDLLKYTVFLSPSLGGAMSGCSLSGAYQFRSILSWGASPSDLDSWAVSVQGVSCDKVYYSNKACSGITLDQDVTTGFGPETITYSSLPVGARIQYVVHQYSSSGTLGNSGALLRVYLGGDNVADCAPAPHCSNKEWAAFDLEVSAGASGSSAVKLLPGTHNGCGGTCTSTGCTGPSITRIGLTQAQAAHNERLLLASHRCSAP